MQSSMLSFESRALNPFDKITFHTPSQEHSGGRKATQYEGSNSFGENAQPQGIAESRTYEQAQSSTLLCDFVAEAQTVRNADQLSPPRLPLDTPPTGFLICPGPSHALSLACIDRDFVDKALGLRCPAMQSQPQIETNAPPLRYQTSDLPSQQYNRDDSPSTGGASADRRHELVGQREGI